MQVYRSALCLVAAVNVASVPLPPLSGYSVVEPEEFALIRQTGESALFEVVLPSGTEYSEGRILIANLTGDREEVGRAYAELLAEETLDTWQNFLHSTFGDNPLVQEAFLSFADWLWDNHHSKHVPAEFLSELEGMRKASPSGRGVTVDQVSKRYNVLANLPAAPQNIITALEDALEKNLPAWETELLNRIINHLDHCDWCVNKPEGQRVPFGLGCDSFGAWGARTSDGSLITSRNLDWARDTGISKHKLVTIMHVPGVPPYATFSHAAGFGALAGMSERGITVSEMNLDNARTSFDGPPFPLRLRMVMEQSDDLVSARAVWEATNNTDSMNFLIGSAKDGKAMAIEAMRGYSGFFTDNDPVEAAATCDVASPAEGRPAGTCGDGFLEIEAIGGKKAIGAPLHNVVWRTNHAMDPHHMPSQMPLSNNTAFRYGLLHDLFSEHEAQGKPLGALEAISVAAALGIKGPDFLSCDPSQFAEGSHILSVVYLPEVGSGHAYASWEDGHLQSWRPAACSTYVHLDLASWWGGRLPGGLVV